MLCTCKAAAEGGALAVHNAPPKVEEEVEVGVPDAATLAASMAALLFKVSTR